MVVFGPPLGPTAGVKGAKTRLALMERMATLLSIGAINPGLRIVRGSWITVVRVVSATGRGGSQRSDVCTSFVFCPMVMGVVGTMGGRAERELSKMSDEGRFLA